MTTVNIWNVEIATVNEVEKQTEWRKIGVNLMWYQVLEVKRKYKGFVTRHVRANNRGAECPTCGAFGGHWLSCKSANAQAVRGTTKRAPDVNEVISMVRSDSKVITTIEVDIDIALNFLESQFSDPEVRWGELRSLIAKQKAAEQKRSADGLCPYCQQKLSLSGFCANLECPA